MLFVFTQTAGPAIAVFPPVPVPGAAPQRLLRGRLLQVPVGGAQGRFQLGKIFRAQQVVHLFPHPVTPVGPASQCLPGRGQVAGADGLNGTVQVGGNVIGKALYLKAAVKGSGQQSGHDGKAGVDPFHFQPSCTVARRSFFKRK